MFAGVLDWLNDDGGATLAFLVVLSLVYLFGQFKFELDRCARTHPRYGRCRLSLHHRPRYKHTNWKGQSWWD